MEIKNLTKEEYEIAMEVINRKREEERKNFILASRLLELRTFAEDTIAEIGLANTKELFRTICKELRG